MRTISKFFLVGLLLISGSYTAVASSQQTGLPTEYSLSSDYRIRYDDWDLLLSSVVLDTGRSDKMASGRNSLRTTGTRIRHGNYSKTANEGNRVLFDEFKQPEKDSLLAIRKDLEAVPDFVPLEQFSKNEQLAYWLNLHNVAVMLEVANEYPIKKVKSLHKGRKQVWNKKSMSIGGVPTSIQDIEDHVVANWNDPLVLYGFFMGAVGGPNIRDHAFTGDNVIEALNQNAREFVNSLRGFRLWSGRGRVSDHYELGARYFPNFEDDIKKHLLSYAQDDTRRSVEKAKSVRADSYDWAIADLKNGDFYAGSSFNTSSASLAFFIESVATSGSGANPSATVVDAFVNDPAFNKDNLGNMPPQTRAFLNALRERNIRRARDGTVTVEEFVSEEGGRIERRSGEERKDTDVNKDGGQLA